MGENDRTDFERRMQARIERRRTEYAAVHEELFGERPQPVAPPPDLSGLPVDQALTAYEAWAEQRTLDTWSEFFQERERERPEPTLATELVDHLAGQPGKQLGLVDKLVNRAFDLDLRLPEIEPAHPLYYCTDLEEYAHPLTKHLGWPRERREFVLQRVRDGATDVPLLSEPVYDLHGVGTFVNGWLLGRQRGISPYAALDGDRAFLAKTLGQVAAARWGRGFLRTYTALGQEMVAARLGHAPLRMAVGLPVPDEFRVVKRAFFLCRAGWSEWVQRFVHLRAHRLLEVHSREGDRWDTLSELGELAWEHVVPNLPGMQLAQGLLNFFLQSAKTLGLTLAFWDKGVNGVRRHYEGQEARPLPCCEQKLRNAVGRILIEDLERRVGTYNLPYALLIAGHVRYGLPGASMPELLGHVREMRENPDGRLVLLTMLEPSTAYDPHRLAVVAEHQLELESPEAIRRPLGTRPVR